MTAADGPRTPPSPITTTTPAAATATTLLFALSCFFLLFHRSLSFQPSLPRLQRRLHEGARRHRGEQQQQQQRRHREGTLRATALPDFSGEWELDLKSSEKMRPMLKACGMSGLLIPLLERLGVRQSIRASGLAAATAGDDTDNDNDDRNKEYQLFVNISTSLSSSSFCLSLDEGGVLVPGPVGAPTRAVSSWGTVEEGSPRESNVADAERRALFTRQFVSAADDAAADERGVQGAAAGTRIFETRRSLRDGGNSLYEDCTVEEVKGGGKTVQLATCRRVLRRRGASVR